ncbi:toll-like receptor 3 [Haliotis cracherodii]|uniref:toll-like receptor 3 n=1 Tax=Haliotis cracherodii TaxID=6455 RepID=UPI0039EB012B
MDILMAAFLALYLGSRGLVSSLPCPPCRCQVFKNGTMQMNCINTNLTEIPSPPKTGKHKYKLSVYFIGNRLPVLTKKIMTPLQTHQNLYYLSLRRNGIRQISCDAFQSLDMLYGLDISDNNVTNTSLEKSFWGLRNHTSLRLNISSMGLHISDDFFHHLQNIPDLNITMRNNSLSEIPHTAMKVLRHLSYLDLGRNDFSDIKLPENYTLWTYELRLDGNKFRKFPNFCILNSSRSQFPNLKRLHFKYNKMEDLNSDHYDCLHSLTHLYLDGSPLRILRRNQFARLPKLYLISLAYVGCAMDKIEGFVFNNTALKHIDFHKNHIWINEHNLTMFHGCTSLESLNLEDNILQKMTQNDFDQLFKDLHFLMYLTIGRGGLYYIPRVITSSLTKLRELELYGNGIPSWEDGRLDNLTRLEKLHMRNNRITVITQRSFPEHFIKGAMSLDFSHNIFSCTCNLLWFVEWMKSNEKIISYLSDYRCESPHFLKGTGLLNLTLSENKCLLSQNERIITLAAGGILIVFLVVGAVMYRYRWHIRYFIYMVRYSQRQEVDTREYEYDAFVAYSAADRQWVIRNMLPVLEGYENLKLCVHDRDFEVGKLIVDNIIDAIETSRKIVIVLSNEFAISDWCLFELNLIQRHVLENGQRLLVVVMLEEIDTRHVTKAMRAMLQTTTYLMWGEEEYARKAFFDRMKMILRRQEQN